MAGKFQKISLYEWVVLALTLLFVVGTLWWFQASKPEAGVTLVEVSDDRQAVTPAEKPAAPGMLEGEVLPLIADQDAAKLQSNDSGIGIYETISLAFGADTIPNSMQALHMLGYEA